MYLESYMSRVLDIPYRANKDKNLFRMTSNACHTHQVNLKKKELIINN